MPYCLKLNQGVSRVELEKVPHVLHTCNHWINAFILYVRGQRISISQFQLRICDSSCIMGPHLTFLVANLSGLCFSSYSPCFFDLLTGQGWGIPGCQIRYPVSYLPPLFWFPLQHWQCNRQPTSTSRLVPLDEQDAKQLSVTNLLAYTERKGCIQAGAHNYRSSL